MRRQIVTKLRDADEWIVNADIQPIEYVFDTDEDTIFTDGIRIIIPDLHLSVRYGIYCYREESEYIPDFSIALIYPENETDVEKWLYWEQDDAATALHNYLYPNAPENIYELTVIIDIIEE